MPNCDHDNECEYDYDDECEYDDDVMMMYVPVYQSRYHSIPYHVLPCTVSFYEKAVRIRSNRLSNIYSRYCTYVR